MQIAGLLGWTEEEFWQSSFIYLEEAYEGWRIGQGATPQETLDTLSDALDEAPKTRPSIKKE